MVTHIVGFVGRRIFPPYVFLVYANGTLGDQNFSALLLKRLNRNDIGLRLTPKHPAARGRKWKIWYPEWEPKSINRPQITVFGSRGVARIFQRGRGGGVTEATHQLVMPTSTSILTKDKSRWRKYFTKKQILKKWAFQQWLLRTRYYHGVFAPWIL